MPVAPRHQERVVLDREAVGVRPAVRGEPGGAGGHRRGDQRVAPEPERRHPARAKRQRRLGERAVGMSAHPGHEGRHGIAGIRVDDRQPRAARRRQPHRDRGHAVALARQPVDHGDREHRAVTVAVAVAAVSCAARRAGNRPGQEGDRVPPRLLPALPCLPPAREQVQVHLVGLGAGDRVVVRAVGELPPRLVERLGRVRRAPQPGERGEPLALEHGHLPGPRGQLGVGIGDVLAGVDRVHVPRLRHDPEPGRLRLRLGAHRREELARYGRREPRPQVARRPLAGDVGHPAGRDHVVGADRQHDVARGRDRRERPELRVRLGERARQVFAVCSRQPAP